MDVLRFFSEQQPEYVFLAAAKVGGIHANSTEPGPFLYENVQIQNNVIHAAQEMDVPRGTNVWFNLQLDPQSTNHGFDGYLRLRPSTPAGVLSQRLAAVSAALGHDFPGPEGNRAFIVESLVDTMVGDLRPMLIIVLSATALFDNTRPAMG